MEAFVAEASFRSPRPGHEMTLEAKAKASGRPGPRSQSHGECSPQGAQLVVGHLQLER